MHTEHAAAHGPAPVAPRARPARPRFRLAALKSLAPLLLVAAVWEAVSQAGWVRPLFLPPLSDVLAELWRLLWSGDLLAPLAVSLGRTGAGVAGAALAGVSLGYLMARYRLMDRLVGPFVSLGFPAPKIALIPVLTLWFGIDDLSKIALVFLTCLFPFILAARAGAQQVPRKMIWAAQSMDVRGAALFFRVILPASVPALLTALRISFPIGLITVFTAEMITGGGLGEAIILAQRYFESTKVYAYIVTTMCVGYLADSLLSQAQRRAET